MIAGRLVSLRPVEDGDLPLIHRWMNEPGVWRGMDYERPFSLADVREDIARSREEGQPFIIVRDGRPIGRIGLNAFRRRDRIASLYMYIGEEDAQGRGFGADAVRTLLAYAFDRMDLGRVELWALGDNEPALALYRSCGFEEEARLSERSWKEGRWVDRVVMSVSREGFAALSDEREAHGHHVPQP
jgi:RimJ/RimL family protein N-acetyltransferase